MANKVVYTSVAQDGRVSTWPDVQDFYMHIGLGDDDSGLVLKLMTDRLNEWIVYHVAEPSVTLYTLKTTVVTIPDTPQELVELDESE